MELLSKLISRCLKICLPLGILVLSGCKLALLDPKGQIAMQEKDLLIDAVLLMLIVVIPVIFMTFWFSWRYRHTNKNAKFRPKWSHSTVLEIIWWAVPCAIIIVLATMTWVTTHKLDPYRPIESDKKPLTVQVVALDWKWLFIYPEQHIAAVNFVQIPVDVPVQFQITADAPMNSFAVPRLAGQIYAMAGMRTKLHVVANEPGDYKGFSSNYSGIGFAEMRFTVRASSQHDFDQWVSKAQSSANNLNLVTYKKLTAQTVNNPVVLYGNVKPGLFQDIINKYMTPDMHMNDGKKEELKL